MTSPITNHTYGQMQHAEYEATARKRQRTPSKPNHEFGVGIKQKIATFFQRTQPQQTAHVLVELQGQA